MKWTERQIAGYLARYTFARKHLVVPNCQWPGSECDLLVVTANLRIVDVEIKTSRADLKLDIHKDKWFHSWDWKIDGPWVRDAPRRPRRWPQRVWKHYYVMPKEVWTPELLGVLPTVSGILLLTEFNSDLFITTERMAKPDRGADKISAEDAIDIARLASLRMWDAYAEADRERMAT